MASSYLPIPAAMGSSPATDPQQQNLDRLLNLLLVQRATPNMRQNSLYNPMMTRAYAGGGDVQSGPQHQDEHLNNMLDEIYSAMSGEHPDPEGAAMDYAHFLMPGSMDDYTHSGMAGGGEEMGGDLGMGDMGGQGEAQQGLVSGPDGGMDDSVNAQTGDGSPVLLSHGEFIVPADVVAMLGDGNTDAGAQRLEDFINQFRQMKYGNNGEQPEQTPEDVFNLLSGPEGAAAPQGGPATSPEGAAPSEEEGEPEEEPQEAPSEEEAEPEQEPPEEEEEEPQPKKRGGTIHKRYK